MWWWRSNLSKNLPLALGPHSPGCMDIMNDYAKDSTFIRLYYPSAFSKEQNDSSKWFRWTPDNKYVEGLAGLVNSWGNVIKLALWFYGGEPLVPAMWEAEPLQSEKKFPVIIFSHGYGATRFLSSTIAIELASRGFVVTSLEHRDSSPCTTYYYESPEAAENDKRTWIPHMALKFGPDHYKIRNEQLKNRTNDVIKLLDFLELINKGEAKNILKSELDLNIFKDRLDLSSISMMGHSFGGATSMLAMSQDDRLKCGVILDGWMFPIKEENLVIEKPLIFINTLTFHIESNLQVMEKYLKETDEIYTMKKTTHESQTDTPHILGYWLNWFMPKLDPVVGTNINNHMTLRFLHKHLGFPEDVSDSEKYLEENEPNFVKGTLLYARMPKRKL